MIKTHVDPVWRDRSNFLIHAIAEDGKPPVLEQLWARQLADNRFEICCIPFFVYDLALGDEVETFRGGEMYYVIKDVVKRSGHYTFRVWFGDSVDPDVRNRVTTEAELANCLCEWYSTELLGIDAPSEIEAKRLANFLAESERLGQLVYETGKLK